MAGEMKNDFYSLKEKVIEPQHRALHFGFMIWSVIFTLSMGKHVPTETSENSSSSNHAQLYVICDKVVGFSFAMAFPIMLSRSREKKVHPFFLRALQLFRAYRRLKLAGHRAGRNSQMSYNVKCQDSISAMCLKDWAGTSRSIEAVYYVKCPIGRFYNRLRLLQLWRRDWRDVTTLQIDVVYFLQLLYDVIATYKLRWHKRESLQLLRHMCDSSLDFIGPLLHATS